MANLTAEQHDILQEILKVITEARQTSERLSESWAKGLANPIGPHTTHLSSPITPMTPSQSPQPPDPPDLLLVDPEPLVETMKNSGPFIESLKSASVLQVPDSFCDVLLVHRVDSHVKEVEESPQQPTNSDDKNVAHQVFAQMPLGVTSKEKQRKSLKAWKFKFKTSFKRSKSMDVKFFSVEEIAWFTRDSKEINWGCVNKEFKEAVAGCGKKIINRFKMVDETSKPAAYDGTFQIRVWDCGGSLLECVWWRRFKHCQRYCHEMQAIEAENKSPETLGDHPFAPMKPCQSYAQPCLKCGAEMTIPLAKETENWMVTAWFKIQVFSDFDIASWIGLKIYGCEYKNHMLLLGYRGLEVQVLSSLQEFGEGSKTDTRIMLCWKKLASLLWFLHGKKLLDGGQKMQSMLVSDFKTWVPHFGYELCLAGTDHVLGLVWSSFENDMNRLWRGPEAVLSFNSEKMGLDWFFQRDLYKSCLDIRRMITLLCSSADYRKLNLWVDTNYCEIRPDKTHVKLQEMSCFLSEKSLVEFVGYKEHGRELLVMVVEQLTLAATKFHLKHKWRSRLLQSFSELKQRIIVSLWKSLGYLMEAHGSKYEGLVYVLERKKLRNIEDDINHLKKLLATLEGLALKISCGLVCGDGKFYLKHKWKSWLIIQAFSRLQFGVENDVLFTSPDKLLFSNKHKLLHPETGFCTQYKDLELLSTEHHSSPGLDYFTYLIFIWKQVLNCCCEAGHVSSRVFSVGGVHGFEAQRKMLLVLNEIPLLENHNKVNLTIEENWFYNKPMIREVFHLQRPPELFDLHENLNFITKVLVQWKEHPPDQFFSGFYGQVLMLSSLRTRMF